MNKAQLISKIAEDAGMQKKEIEKVINSFVNVVTDTLKSGEKIQMVGFGTFEVRERAERKGFNPSTKAEITIPASKAPVFKAGKGLKDAIN